MRVDAGLLSRRIVHREKSAAMESRRAGTKIWVCTKLFVGSDFRFNIVFDEMSDLLMKVIFRLWQRDGGGNKKLGKSFDS